MELREALASIEHEQWQHWTAYMLDNLTPENIARWRRQCDTPYDALSEREKDSDREWADKVLVLVRAYAAQCQPKGTLTMDTLLDHLFAMSMDEWAMAGDALGLAILATEREYAGLSDPAPRHLLCTRIDRMKTTAVKLAALQQNAYLLTLPDHPFHKAALAWLKSQDPHYGAAATLLATTQKEI